ncbi:luciferase [Sphaerisporangium krabiense]|uniref:Alkanesulfonate monooxygenase SsuD/methylene tetrahydromethanopterin reductase-like flavin-dependent oxidoreductase (Luciferase family) n=1 Tax=Sphaerisporangium krabiense TaxID=763782 RepID=A0A7W8Z2N4_9ACTN|nr:LLM class flavin-dependent oxidoreductase [Sphaerisporangium krabiense]MBB5626130.1 alkanesulfonate monooxygenase SsuD/methylene tetrahydromethanopterin reductase-like flavin-dependent oxidoreductase (luciferase family) [Sphaerisporangium krabiense]GII67465.1 luciferase [Sphaerisporangium krabiense]
MDLGLFLSYQVNDDAQYEGVYDRMLACAVAADRAGFARVWVPEHHLVQFLPAPSALIQAAAIAQHVECRVGTAVVVLPYHAPLQLAAEVAATDHLTGGRLDFGVARGAYKYEFDIFGIDFRTSLPRFIETLDAVRALWLTGDAGASFTGEYVNFEGAYVWPRPRQLPHPPIWVGSQAPAAVEDAAARGYNVLNSLFLWDDDHAAKVVEAFKRGQAKAGLAGRTQLGMTRYAFVVEDEAEVEPRLREILEGWRIHRQLHDFTQNADARGIVRPVPGPDEPTLDELRATLLVGTPGQVRDKMRFYRDAGVDLLNLNLTFGAPQELTLRSIELFGEIAASLGEPAVAR